MKKVATKGNTPGGKQLISPAWNSAADLLFGKGLKEARENIQKESDAAMHLHRMATLAGTVDVAATSDKVKSLRHRFMFQFLARFCETFPECKKDLLRYDIARGYCDGIQPGLADDSGDMGSAAKRDMFSALQKQPLCKPETLRFLRAYLEGNDPLWKLSLSECARRMGWFTDQQKPDYKRVKATLREYGITHGMKGKPGRPKTKK